MSASSKEEEKHSVENSDKLENKQDYSNYYETFFDETYQRNYYYHTLTKTSHWEVPSNAIIKPLEETQNLKAKPKNSKNEGEDKDGEESEGESSEEEKENPGKAKPSNEGLGEMNKEKAELEKLSELYPEYFKRKEEVEDDSESDSEYEKDHAIFQIEGKKRIDELMKRPARKQVTHTAKETAYQEGNYDYNIWYDKFLTDRKQEQERAPSLWKCNFLLDTGYTKADFQEKKTAFFCIYFSRGCCTEGADCRFCHRPPQPEVLEFCGILLE